MIEKYAVRKNFKKAINQEGMKMQEKAAASIPKTCEL